MLEAQHRLDLWADADVRVEVFVEKEGLADVLWSDVQPLGVCLRPAKGFSSYTYFRKVAREIEE